MITVSDLKAARERIAWFFIEQCKNGPQVKRLTAGTKACGQFLGEKASVQRGLHGTAAAIRVLAEDRRADALALLPELVTYVLQRRAVEEKSGEVEPATLAHQLTRDNANVIKVSELLYALTFVQGPDCDTEALKHDLCKRLSNGQISEHGWGYFLDVKNGEPQLLPTAHAVRALARYGSDVQRPVEYLVNALTTPSSLRPHASRADVSVSVFILYVLAFARTGVDIVPKGRIREIFWSIWKPLERLLNFEDLEQNVEYRRDGDHLYVRVPWQIYLIALACRVAPWRAFASHAAQRRLESIIRAVETKEGFVYPHSGERMSSRTNAILYESISIVAQELAKAPSSLLRLAHMLDRVRRSLDAPSVRWILGIGAFFLMSVSVYTWHGQGGAFSDVAPSFIAYFILFLFTARKGR